MTPTEQKIAIATLQEDELFNLHFSLGMAIRNAFGPHTADSKLVASLNNTLHPGALYNSVHPDDASEVIVKVLWGKLTSTKGTYV